MSEALQFTIRVITIRNALIAIIASLWLLHLLTVVFTRMTGHDYVYGLMPLFNLGMERNVPTYVATGLLLSASWLLFLVGRDWHRRRQPLAGYWQLLSAIFLLMSLDEFVSIHELITPPLRAALDLTGYLYFSWVLVGFAAVATIGLWSIRLLLSLPSATRWRLILAGVLFCGGALGVELIGGYHDERYGRDFIYQLITSVEEVLELSGVSLLIVTLLRHLQQQGTRVGFSVS